MRSASILRIAIVLVAVLLWTAIASAQAGDAVLEISGRVRIEKKVEKLIRKRFFLFRGGLEANKALVDKMKSASVTSRECFYCTKSASPEFLAWLKAEDCESPYCRAITADDAKKVPEFQTAYQKGLRQFRNKPDLSLQWLTTNLPSPFLSGLYDQRKAAFDSIVGQTRAVQSSMTDSVSVKAIFINVPVAPQSPATSEKFLATNVVPIEFNGKAYLWACEVELSGSKKSTLVLQVPDPGKTVRNCEVVVKELPKCTGGTCSAQ